MVVGARPLLLLIHGCWRKATTVTINICVVSLIKYGATVFLGILTMAITMAALPHSTIAVTGTSHGERSKYLQPKTPRVHGRQCCQASAISLYQSLQTRRRNVHVHTKSSYCNS